MGHQMLLTEFYPDRPLLPFQQNSRQNGLYLGLYNTITKILASEGGAGWGFGN